MTTSEKIAALEQKTADMQRSFNEARTESQDKVLARFEEAKARAAKHEQKKADRAAEANGQWQQLKADAMAKHQEHMDVLDQKRHALDVKVAQKVAAQAEVDADDAIDFADWAIDQAYVAVLDALDARAWADSEMSSTAT